MEAFGSCPCNKRSSNSRLIDLANEVADSFVKSNGRKEAYSKASASIPSLIALQKKDMELLNTIHSDPLIRGMSSLLVIGNFANMLNLAAYRAEKSEEVKALRELSKDIVRKSNTIQNETLSLLKNKAPQDVSARKMVIENSKEIKNVLSKINTHEMRNLLHKENFDIYVGNKVLIIFIIIFIVGIGITAFLCHFWGYGAQMRKAEMNRAQVNF